MRSKLNNILELAKLLMYGCGCVVTMAAITFVIAACVVGMLILVAKYAAWLWNLL